MVIDDIGLHRIFHDLTVNKRSESRIAFIPLKNKAFAREKLMRHGKTFYAPITKEIYYFEEVVNLKSHVTNLLLHVFLTLRQNNARTIEINSFRVIKLN